MAADSKQRETWSGKWMFILAAAGSAVGLGNMWRFPYLAAKYGGGTFLITYIILVFTLGLSLLLLDMTIGRYTQLSTIGAFKVRGRKWGFIGILSSAVPFIITPYYCVIGGWVAKYAAAYLTDGPAALADGGTFFSAFITSDVESFLWMGLFAIIVLVCVGFGVKGGIEKVNLVLMPLLIIMAVGIAIYTATIPGALDGIAYYLTPDFSKMSVELILAAIGQTFFSLSISMAIMVTYGSYVSKQESLTHGASRTVAFDLLVSVLAGFMVVPGAYATLGSASAVAAKSGPSLMFITLPQVFDDMGGVAVVVGTVFFLLALFAAITSAISLTEACVSIVKDGLHMGRVKATVIVAVYILLVGAFVNCGYNVLSSFQPLGAGSSILDLFDFISNTVLMPIVSILTCLWVGWILKPKTLVDEIRLNGPFKLATAWTIIIRFVAPILVFAVLVAYIMAQFGFISL